MMTESSSSSSVPPKPLVSSTLTLSAAKLINFTSSSDNNVPSTMTKATGEIQSSFGLISQTCDVVSLENKPSSEIDFQRKHPPLERDLRRLDLESNNNHDLMSKRRALERTESTSFPCTPIDQISSSLNMKRETVNLSQIKTTSDGPRDGELYNSLYNADMQQSNTGESISRSQSTLKSVSSSSSTDSNIPTFYGVNWSENALPTSHCWFAFTPNDPSSCQPCSYSSCTNPKPSLLLSVVQCESCLIIIHTHHLQDLRTSASPISNFIPPCRPSFCDSHNFDDQHYFDHHFWISVSVLNKPCVLCKRKSISSSLFGNSRTSAVPILDLISANSNYRSPIPGSAAQAAIGAALQCLWCSRTYHRRCWEQNSSSQDERNKCDYGVFRQIIVRPQWIHRDTSSRTGFRAHYPTNVDYQSNCTPLLLFINKRSGGQSGEKIYRKLLHLLNPRQVFLLENDQTIINALEIYASLENTRICVFGGDGTVGWVLGRLAESFPSLNNPPVCICPLGTGNDLSRVLSWGDQYDPKRLLPTLTQIPYAQPIALDRWQVFIEPFDSKLAENNFNGGGKLAAGITHPKFIRDTKRPSFQNHRTLPNSRFINYMSFGLDAAIALEFHDRRSRDPSKFSSPLKNKLMYLNESRKYLNDFARSRMWSLSSYIRLICDGDDLTHLIQNCHTLLVLNIPGYASGTNPWGKSSSATSSQQSSIQKDSDSFEQISTSSVDLVDYPANTHEVYELITLNECSNDQMNSSMRTTASSSQSGRFERQDFGDKRIEVVGLSTTHMAAIHIGFRGIRIAQCNQLRIELCCPMTAQMDGEPFYLPESVIVNITHAGQVLVLRNAN